MARKAKRIPMHAAIAIGLFGGTAVALALLGTAFAIVTSIKG